MRGAGPRLSERLASVHAAELFGRERELGLLGAQLGGSGAVVTFVHGIGGIGKTALLAAAAPRLERAGARVLRLDGRSIEPTPRGFFAALARGLGASGLSEVDALAAELEREPAPTVFVVDEFDGLRLLDDWLRQSLLPALPERTRWIFAGRFAPSSAWLTTAGWSDAVLPLRLEALGDEDAAALLARRGVPPARVPRLLGIARGTPLALTLIALELGAAPGAPDVLPEASLPRAEEPAVNESALLAALAQRSVQSLPESLREALEGAAVVRRINRPLLEAMLGRPCGADLLGELGELSFIEPADDGLVLHETVRQALASRLRALDPARYRRLRLAAWRALEAQLEGSAPTGPDAWRLTADLLFVVEHAEVREAFFPSAESPLSLGAAQAEDHAALAAMVLRHERPEWRAVFDAWWRLCRSAFRVVRDASGAAVGFVMVAPSRQLPAELGRHDPLLATWRADLERGPGRERGALFMRRALSAASGERLDEVRSAIWLDVKRAYVEWPAQWALYVGTRRAEESFPFIQRFGFSRAALDWQDESTLRLEFGAAGIWTWLRGLVDEAVVGHRGDAAASGPALPESNTAAPAAPRWRLDPAARGLVVAGRAHPLSALEYRVLGFLSERAGRVVTRDELLDGVWQQRHTGSNVVDAVIRLLRKKLGPCAADLETVRGHGYRLARPGAEG